jgi:hypothetical protein
MAKSSPSSRTSFITTSVIVVNPAILAALHRRSTTTM